MNPNQHIVDVSKLIFRYGAAEVLHEISFSLNKGGIIGLLGPNGAGSSGAQVQKFQRDRSFEARVEGAINSRHASASQLRDDLIRTYQLAYHRGISLRAEGQYFSDRTAAPSYH